MKKTRNLITASVISIILLLSFVAAQSTNPWSASTAGIEKNLFKSSDSIYIRSGKLCEPASEIDLYIVEDNNNWSDGDALEDVRGAAEPVVLINSAIPLSKIWDKPTSGNFDFVADCNKNGVYDEFIDKVDSFSSAGFEVESVAGIAKADKGSNNIKEHKWQYDVEDPILANEMLQIALTANIEDVELVNMTIIATGNGEDTRIDALEVYVDENNNGKFDEDESIIGDFQPAYTANNGKTTIELDYFLTKDVTENILIVYQLKDNTSQGDYSLKVDSIIGIGGDSNKAIKFLGLPIESAKLTVLPIKTCIGEASLLLIPNPVKPGLNVEAEISDLNGCDGKEVVLSSTPCGASSVKSVGKCTLKDSTCKIAFKSSSSITYYVCIDKNSDGDFLDFGEYALKDLKVDTPVNESIPKPIENETEIEEEEEEETETETESEEEVKNTTGGITGGVSGIAGEIAETSSFFILLEVTLLLILFVLVMILFRLRPVVVEAQKEPEKEVIKEPVKETPKQEEKNGKEKKKK